MKLSIIPTMVKGVISKGAIIMVEKKKDTHIKLRVSSDFKDSFYTYCSSKAINPSELVRILIKDWLTAEKEKDKAI